MSTHINKNNRPTIIISAQDVVAKPKPSALIANNLRIAGKAAVETIRSSHYARYCAEKMAQHVMDKILDPQGKVIKTLSHHPTLGPIVKVVINHERYAELARHVTASAVKITGRAFIVREEEPHPMKVVQEAEKETLPSPMNAYLSWGTTIPTSTTLHYKGKVVSE